MAEANRVKALYDQTVIPAMIKKFNYKCRPTSQNIHNGSPLPFPQANSIVIVIYRNHIK